MLDQRLLTFIGSLSSFGERPRAARKLANALGADDLILFTKDPAMDLLLPAPGLPQTLPDGRKWREFLSECARLKHHSAQLISPYEMKLVTVLGVSSADGSILALLGGSADLDLVVEVCTLIPLLAAALNTERVTLIAKGQIESETESAQQAKALAKALDVTRRELQGALNERNRSAEALRESHEWFSTTLKSIGDAVIAVTVESTVSYLNPIAEELTGWKLQEAVGKPMGEVFNIIHEKTREPAFNPVEKVLRDGKIVGLANHTALIRRDGVEFIIEDSAAPIKSENGDLKGVVLIFRDATERHQADEEQRRILAALQSERDLREKFVATLTHDLRNPLSAAKTSAQLIERRATDASHVKLAERIGRSINRVDDMIQDLLDANHIRAGQHLPISIAECDLKDMISDSIDELAAAHGDRFVYRADDSVRGVWDCGALRRVFENLVTNAVKYGTLGTPITVTLKRLVDSAELAVQNQGPVISPEEQKNIFRPFARTSSAERSGQKGWGIGLTLVKGLTEAHQGAVRVESSPEAGTIFTVTLPTKGG